MRILLTGASGFVGRNLISQLSGDHELFAIVRDAASVDRLDPPCGVKIDLAQPIDMKDLPERMDVIIHLAQSNGAFPEAANELFAVHAHATQQLLDYGRRAGAHQFILASTGDVYGERFDYCRETDPVAPASYYAATKVASEIVARAYSGYFRPCIFRLFRPYGPGQTGRLIPNLARRIRERKAVRLHKGGHPLMSPIYIDDVIHAIERAMTLSCSGTINIAGDTVVSMLELTHGIARALGTEPTFEESVTESGDQIGDNGLMKKVLGEWRMVSLADGLSRTFEGEEAIPWRVHV